jgi:hypothetical protein
MEYLISRSHYIAVKKMSITSFTCIYVFTVTMNSDIDYYMNRLLRSKEAAAALGLKSSSMRVLEKRGLIRATRDWSGHRRFMSAMFSNYAIIFFLMVRRIHRKPHDQTFHR